MAAGHCSSATRLDADQFDTRITNERVKHPRGVAAAAHTGHDNIGQPAGLVQALLARLRREGNGGALAVVTTAGASRADLESVARLRTRFGLVDSARTPTCHIRMIMS